MTTAQRVRRVLVTGGHEQDHRFHLQELGDGAYVTVHLMSQEQRLTYADGRTATSQLFGDDVYQCADMLYAAGFMVALRRDGQRVVIDVR